MTKTNKLHVRIVLDRSGSMMNAVDTTVSAINEYVNSLKAQKQKGTITISTFDNVSIDVPYSGIKIKDFPILTNSVLQPRGMTPLYDAVAKAIDETEEKSNTDRVALVIVTDGMENASKEFTKPEQIKAKIKAKEKKDWLVVYLGADHDAFTQSSSLGIDFSKTLQYDKTKTVRAMRGLTGMSMAYASGQSVGQTSFTAEDRKESI